MIGLYLSLSPLQCLTVFSQVLRPKLHVHDFLSIFTILYDI